MLWSKLEGLTVKTPMGDKLGKVSDLVTSLEDWKIKYILLKEGLVKSKLEAVKTSDVSVEEDHLEVSPEVEREEIKKEMSSMHNLYMSDIIKKMVKSSDGEEVGKVYDIEIATELRNWEAWKILIKTGIKERRLKLSVSRDVKTVGEYVELKLSSEDLENKKAPEENS